MPQDDADQARPGTVIGTLRLLIDTCHVDTVVCKHLDVAINNGCLGTFMFHNRLPIRTATSVAAVISLTACNPPQPLNFSVQNVQPSATSIDADLKDVTVTPAAPNERTGSLPPGVASVTTTWKEATDEALGRAAIFNDDSRRHVNLEVKILKFDAPSVGFTFPTYTDARYTLIDRSNGQAIFSKIISAEGDTPLDFAFVGAIRARESINRAAQNNIAAFIEDLEQSPVAVARGQTPGTPVVAPAAQIE